MLSTKSGNPISPSSHTALDLNSRVGIWIEAARPKTLWAGISPVLLGVALAYSDGLFHAVSAILALTGAVLIQVGTNFHNDLADFKKGADTPDRLGPRRAVQSGMVTPAAMKMATYLTFLAALLSGIYLMMRGGLPIVVIGFSSILFGLLYTGGRYSLAYLGIADVFVLIFFGPLAVAGTYFVQGLSWPIEVWIAGLGPGLLSVGILLANNIRDYQQDGRVGKKTIVVRLGRDAGIRIYIACMILAAAVPLVLWKEYDSPAWILLSLLATPLFFKAATLLRVIPEEDGERLNGVLAMTARNLLIYTILFSLGWVVAA